VSDYIDAVKKRLNKADIIDSNDCFNELREISQEILLSGLAKHGFFENAVFIVD
jgi:hypothetical protein